MSHQLAKESERPRSSSVCPTTKTRQESHLHPQSHSRFKPRASTISAIISPAILLLATELFTPGQQSAVTNQQAAPEPNDTALFEPLG